MKKKVVLFVTLMLSALMLCTLCACSSFGGIKSAFKKNGFEEVALTDEIEELFKDNEDYANVKDVVKLHVLRKKADDSLFGALNNLNFAIIAEFNGNKEMEEALKSHVTQQDAENIYEELQKLDSVNGNCYLLFATSPSEALNIFKSAK